LINPRRAILNALSRRAQGGDLPIQAAALPWRCDQAGDIEVLLITSRSSGRWMIPKGHPMWGKTLAQSASIEAFEEAGVQGSADQAPLGHFIHRKRHWLTGSVAYRVIVHALRVEKMAPKWPEQSQRERNWVGCDEAAALVHSSDLAAILRAFGVTERSSSAMRPKRS
jgi:8-oxo-dGTP pyrophosphatase MutT (NUDIX family)